MMGDVQSRIQQLEKQLVELESLSPEYVQSMVCRYIRQISDTCDLLCRFPVDSRAGGKPLGHTHIVLLFLP